MRATIERLESWGRIIYEGAKDEFRAAVRHGERPIPSAPLGVGWVINGGCNLKCIHCYGNAEALPTEELSTNDCIKVVEALAAAGVMRVVISGGEPMLRDDIFTILRRLAAHDIGVVLGTNGSFIKAENVTQLIDYTRVEISLDASTAELNDRIRPSRRRRGDAWNETLRALQICALKNVPVRVLTTLNVWNQNQIVGIAKILSGLRIDDWALSWTIPAGRALPIYDQLRPDEAVITEQIAEARARFPSLMIRYSNRATGYNRFYCLVLPDGQVATEDIGQGKKVVFGSLLEAPLKSIWREESFDIPAHFRKWVADRVTYFT